MHDRRNFLKIFGLTSAKIVGASGEVERVTLPSSTNSVSVPKFAGDYYDIEKWETRANGWDVVDQFLFDQITIKKNGLKAGHEFFNGFFNADNHITNVLSPRKLDAPQVFAADSFGVTFSPGIIPELRNAVISRYSLTLFIGPRSFFTAPFSELFTENNSDPTANLKGRYKLSMPVILAYDHSFYMVMTGTPLLVHPKFHVSAVIGGTMARSIV